MLKSALALLSLAVVPLVAAHAGASDQPDLKARLAVAPSRAACVEFAQRFRPFGEVHSLSFESHTPPIFVIWTEPKPGDGLMSFVFGYFLRDGKWLLFLDELVEARPVAVQLSQEGDRLIVVSTDDKEVLSTSVREPKSLMD